MEENMFVTRDPNFDFDENLKHETEFIINSN